MNLLGLHFKVRRWFLDLFKDPEDSPGERLGRALREFVIERGGVK